MDREIIVVIFQEMPELIDLEITFWADGFCLDRVSQNLRIKRVEIRAFEETVINLIKLLPNLESLSLPLRIYNKLELMETVNQKLKKLKKMHFGQWNDNNLAICLPSVVEASFYFHKSYLTDIVKLTPFMEQFLDNNRQIQIVHLSKCLINEIDFSQYKNFKVIKYLW